MTIDKNHVRLLKYNRMISSLEKEKDEILKIKHVYVKEQNFLKACEYREKEIIIDKKINELYENRHIS